MAVTNNPDLDTLFREELTERAESLRAGAASVIEGTVTPDLASTMVREGHTIKGTGRVMGHELIARGGEACEVIWRWIQHGDLAPTPLLGRALAHLADALPDAIGGSTVAVSGAIDTLRTLVADPSMVKDLPEPMDGDEPDDPLPAEDAAEPGVTGDPTSDEDSAPDASPAVAATEDVASASDGDESGSDGDAADPLVFEPNADGKLSSNVVTSEIIRSAFAGGTEAAAVSTHRPQPDESTATALNELSVDLSYLEPQRSVLDPDAVPPSGLGGLVGVVETWAAEESVPVNAGRLFRLINDVAALRIDVESVTSLALQVLRSGGSQTVPAVDSAIESLETVRRAAVDLQENALNLTMVSLDGVAATLPQLLKYVSKKTEKSVELVVEGQDTIVDRQLVDRIGEIIRQLIVNAVVHGIEAPAERSSGGKPSTGTVSVVIGKDDQHITLVVTDDGGGIDWTAVRETAVGTQMLEGDPSSEDLRSVLFSPGFSTNPRSSEFVRDGDGLAAVTRAVEEAYGTITMASSSDGTAFTVTLPAHRALQPARLFLAGGRSWGIPQSAVTEVLSVRDVQIEVSGRGSTITHAGEPIPYASFATVAGLEIEGLPSEVMVIQSQTGTIALSVDKVLDVHEVATKDLGPLLSGASVVSGVALLGGDDTVLLVNASRLAENLRGDDGRDSASVHTVLVVDDSQGVRQVVSGVLASHGFATMSAGSVAEALGLLGDFEADALVVDFSMPRADGVALVHMVRQRYGKIPIVMLSGVASDEDRDRAERAGADAFFDKSDFAKGALVETLRDLIEAEDNRPQTTDHRPEADEVVGQSVLPEAPIHDVASPEHGD
jgi:chemotaxis protein histidine kinase CheA/FixJ family two-component response regulator